MRINPTIVLTPVDVLDPSLAIAADRAGAFGVLNLEFANEMANIVPALARLEKHIRHQCGLKLNSAYVDVAMAVVDNLPTQTTAVIVTAQDPEAVASIADLYRSHHCAVFLEITDIAQLNLAGEIEADGIIVKGNEAPGFVGEQTTFILLQRALKSTTLPVWAYGGIGLHTAAASMVAGAAGLVLDSQLALVRESPRSEAERRLITRMDGSETHCLKAKNGMLCRTYHSPFGAPFSNGAPFSGAERLPVDVDLLEETAFGDDVARDPLSVHVWPLGQAAAFAAPLAERYLTVAGVVQAFARAIIEHCDQVANTAPFGEHASYAHAIGTRYPIVQGPMTRVSDRAPVALAVAENGALPFLALSLMRGSAVEALLAETQRLVGDRPWGVGILGFVPYELREEQLEVIRRYRPPFALIAGGRPDQAAELESLGITTYLHVPSPGLLKQFIEEGARHFVFEGRECGGHVGPRSSFVLWDKVVDILLESASTGEADQYHLLFAGGIHDRVSAAMVATLAAPLSDFGMHVGLLMGTAYLFTEELVSAGGILPNYQAVALSCAETTLLESGVGHSTRCVTSPYVDYFQAEKRRLNNEQLATERVRERLEALNIGRLRMATKGVTRHPEFGTRPDVPKFVELSTTEQWEEGMFMIGQVATMHSQTLTMADLHHEIAAGSTEWLTRLTDSDELSLETAEAAAPTRSQIAIVGMSTLLPGANDLHTFWENILDGVDAIKPVPKERWDADLYFDDDPDAKDKIYSRVGGFLDDIPFDPLEFGIPPNSLSSIDPLHLLALVAARDALKDAGYYKTRPFDRSQTSVILGASGGTGDLGANYLLRSGLPLLFGEQGFELAEQAGAVLPEWTEDSFAGLLLNVAAGRIANRFDFGGLNYVVDAACASSLAAVHMAVKELETNNSAVVIAGGVDTVQNPFGYLCFSKTHALSPTGEPRVFDESGDGIVISEGVVMLVLKRLADAERDGDRIYAVIQGVGGSSDGRAMGMTAPRPEGQALALQRAYEKAGIAPQTVGLFEAHGTGTAVGDRTEVATLSAFLQSHEAETGRHALGSVKSMIGHTKASAGVAGIAKVASALFHKTLPQTMRVRQPNQKAGFDHSPLYVNSETRPWFSRLDGQPRRAGVSAFGFGGTNFHAVLEEYEGGYLNDEPAMRHRWPTELFLWRAESVDQLKAAVQRLHTYIEATRTGGDAPLLRDLAYTLFQSLSPNGKLRLAITAHSLDALIANAKTAIEILQSPPETPIVDPRGIFLSGTSSTEPPKIAFLYPGQGSQRVNMLRDVALIFPQVRSLFEQFNAVLEDRFERPLTDYIFPIPAFTAEAKKGQQTQLAQTDIAQPALGAAEMGMTQLLAAFGVHPDLVAGHSYGEYVALCAAGAIDLATLAELSHTRGQLMLEAVAAEGDSGTMIALFMDEAAARSLIDDIDQLWIANLNGPHQTIVSGASDAMAQLRARLDNRAIDYRSLPVSCAFHSPLVAGAQGKLAAQLAKIKLKSPQRHVYANVTGQRYPDDVTALRQVLAEQLTAPVRFGDELAALYQDGARLFIEVGPGTVLTNLVRRNLNGQPFMALPTETASGDGVSVLLNLLGQLFVQPIDLNMRPLFSGRDVRRLQFSATKPPNPRIEQPTPTTFLINGSRARLHSAAEVDRTPPLAAGATSSALASDAAEPLAAPVPAPPETRLQHGEMGVSQPTTVADIQGDNDMQYLNGNSEPHSVQSESAPEGADFVMEQFQKTMSNFLDTQRAVMLAYLGKEGQTESLQPALPQRTRPVTPRPRRAAVRPPAPRTTVVKEVQSTPANGAMHEAIQSHPPEAIRETPTPKSAERSTVAPPTSEIISGREQIQARLVDIVSDRTGYPPEALPLDVDIEANLGIDSIKRVEILGVLRRDCFPKGYDLASSAMEELTSIKTLGGIIDWVNEAQAQVDGPVNGNGSGLIPESLMVEKGEDSGKVSKVPRASFRTKLAPALPSVAPAVIANQLIMVTDDGHGVALHLCQLIQQSGGQAILIEVPDTVPAAAAAVQQARDQFGSVTGLVHFALDVHAIHDRLWPTASEARSWFQRSIKGVSYLLSLIANDLKEAARQGAGWVLGVTRLADDYLPESHTHLEPALSAGAGLASLIKSVAQEWENIQARTIHFSVRGQERLSDARERTRISHLVLQEMTAGSRQPTEICYDQRERFELIPMPRPLPRDVQHSENVINGDDVIVCLGGARGITAEVAIAIAKTYQPTLVLVGRSPEPLAEEPADIAAAATEKALRTILWKKQAAAGGDVQLQDIERQLGRIMRAREVRQNLGRMEMAGSTVLYAPVDVRDEIGMATLMTDLYTRFGKISGVIHGAGVVEDKLLVDKTPDSFDRVFDTKVDSALTLIRLLKPNQLKFLYFFSSASAAFGNRGQSDYAAANGVLNHLAQRLNAAWPTSVVAFNWGPWKTTGMVSAALQDMFAARGIDLIEIPAGCQAVLEELRVGDKSVAAPIYASGSWGATPDEPAETGFGHEHLPLLSTAVCTNREVRRVVYERTIDSQVDHFLMDHVLDGQPVFPFAMALELMCECVAAGWPDQSISAVHDMQVLAGIVVNSPVEVRIDAQLSERQDNSDGQMVQVVIIMKDTARIHYRARIELTAAATPVEAVVPIDGMVQPLPLLMAEIYTKWLFHGPSFAGLQTIDGVTSRMLTGEIAPVKQVQLLATARQPVWQVDPTVFDSSLQMIIVWMRHFWNVTPLPSRFKRFRGFGVWETTSIQAHLIIPEDAERGMIIAVDIIFVDNISGRVIAVLEGMECPNSPELNRLADHTKKRETV